MIEFNKLFKKLIHDESIEDIPIKYVIRIFAAIRTILESEE